MKTSINLFSEKSGEIKKFLELFYSQHLFIENEFYYQKEFDSPIEMIDLISCFIDNNEKLWGKKIGRYTIYPPLKLIEFKPIYVIFTIKNKF